MRTIVVSQPMFFPWVGLFEQIRLADVYIHFDDIPFPNSASFINRVQIKSPHGEGFQWLTVPVVRERGKTPTIQEVKIDNNQPWRKKHLKTLENFYAKAPFKEEMLTLVQSIYQLETDRLNILNQHALETLCHYFGFQPQFATSSTVPGGNLAASHRLYQLVKTFGGTHYVTGHGAKNYLDHALFETQQITVQYMAYQRTPYSQLHGPFNPHVSILDLIANCGKAGESVIQSSAIHWQEALKTGTLPLASTAVV